MIIDFGPGKGLWVWTNNRFWVRRHGLSPEVMENSEKKIKLTGPLTFRGPVNPLPEGTKGVFYSIYFCTPAPSAKCGDPFNVPRTTDPNGGAPPYTFKLDSGIGFPPFGIRLNTFTGRLSGTPTAAGTRDFGVCAVDLVGTNVCHNYKLEIKLPLSVRATTSTLSSGPAPFTAKFTAEASGGKPPYKFLWDFDDGQTSSLANPTHTYTSPGSFTPCITVTDSAGRRFRGCRIDPFIVTAPQSSGQCDGAFSTRPCASCSTDADCGGTGVCTTLLPAPFCG